MESHASVMHLLPYATSGGHGCGSLPCKKIPDRRGFTTRRFGVGGRLARRPLRFPLAPQRVLLPTEGTRILARCRFPPRPLRAAGLLIHREGQHGRASPCRATWREIAVGILS
jgi:hypothetical protein